MKQSGNGDHDEELRKLAQLGARARLVEIDAERERLLSMFPELGKTKRGPIAKASAEPTVIFESPEHAPSERSPSGRRQRRKHTDAFKAEIVERLRRGEYLSDVARIADVGPSVIKRWADAAGVTIAEMPMEERIERHRRAKLGEIKTPWRDTNGAPSRPQLRDELLRRVAAGENPSAVGRALGVNPSTARGWVAAAKSKTDKHKRRR